jgi:hypothetical protein
MGSKGKGDGLRGIPRSPFALGGGKVEGGETTDGEGGAPGLEKWHGGSFGCAGRGAGSRVE